ncbi:MAG: FHA domain-containing protein [Myxococcaceae bacterium]|jgi:pSer/pThr/pTyr-binding forkhead associated (FHA) protein|nr:FHA domain-containing protein [Myxococcaceae bacterium]MCA3015632.1 FHA domain-containing protein [Myxococcaceae bacterium]
MATRTQTIDDDAPQTMMNRLQAGFRPRPRRAHRLEQTAGPGSGARHELSADLLVIGRGSSADLRVESDDVSRMHARLQRLDDEYSIEDLDSRNGVFLNGLRVHAAVLRDGDTLQLGDTVFTYTEGA